MYNISHVSKLVFVLRTSFILSQTYVYIIEQVLGNELKYTICLCHFFCRWRKCRSGWTTKENVRKEVNEARDEERKGPKKENWEKYACCLIMS